MNKDQRNTRRGGFYFNNGNPYLSVTTALKVLDKPAVNYWFGNEIYWAMVADPSLSEKEAMSAPYQKSEQAINRGRTVHSIIEAWKNLDDLDFVSKESNIYGYVQAFKFFLKDHSDIQLLEQEKTVYSHKHMFAGTLDIYAMVGGRASIIDVKTNEQGNLYDEVELQASAYKRGMIENGFNVDDMYGLALGANGQYTFKKLDDEFDAFLHAKELYVWKNKKKCQKIGYRVN